MIHEKPLTGQEMTLLEIIHDRFGMRWIAKDRFTLGGCVTAFAEEPVDIDGEWFPVNDTAYSDMCVESYINIMLDQDVDIDPMADHFKWLSFGDGAVNIEQLMKENEGRNHNG